MFCLHWETHSSQGNAKLDGLLDQLDLTGDRYNVALVRHFSLPEQMGLLTCVTDYVFRRMYLTPFLGPAF